MSTSELCDGAVIIEILMDGAEPDMLVRWSKVEAPHLYADDAILVAESEEMGRMCIGRGS